MNSQAGTPALPVEAAARRGVGLVNWLGRTVAVLLVASLAAGGSYFGMKAILFQTMRARIDRVVAAGAIGREGNQPAPRPTEPARDSLAPRNRVFSPRKVPDLAGTLSLTVFVAVIGRYVFRLRL